MVPSGTKLSVTSSGCGQALPETESGTSRDSSGSTSRRVRGRARERNFDLPNPNINLSIPRRCWSDSHPGHRARGAHPFGNLAAVASQNGLRQAHGFASPPFGDFAVSGMKRFFQGDPQSGKGFIPAGWPFYRPHATTLGREQGRVKPLFSSFRNNPADTRRGGGTGPAREASR